jgi:hypothetical protein
MAGQHDHAQPPEPDKDADWKNAETDAILHEISMKNHS